MHNMVREDGNWGLLGTMGLMNVAACAHTGGNLSFAHFPTYLMKMSTANKKRRLLRELRPHIARKASTGRTALRLQYASALCTRAIAPLAKRGEAGVSDTLDFLESYGLGSEHLSEHLADFQLPGEVPEYDIFFDIDHLIINYFRNVLFFASVVKVQLYRQIQ